MAKGNLTVRVKMTGLQNFRVRMFYWRVYWAVVGRVFDWYVESELRDELRAEKKIGGI